MAKKTSSNSELTSGGTYSNALAAFLVFYDEIKRYTMSHNTVHLIDGIVVDSSNQKKVKIKLQNNTEVYVDCNFAYVKNNDWVLLIETEDRTGKLNYQFLSKRRIGQAADGSPKLYRN